MHRAGCNVEKVTGMDGTGMQQLFPLTPVDLFGQSLIAAGRVTHDDISPRLAVQNVPALCLTQTAVFVTACIAIIRVHLNAQILLCMDHLYQQRKTIPANVPEQFLMLLPQPAQGLALIFSCCDLTVAIGMGTCDPRFARVVTGNLKSPLCKRRTAPDGLFENRF